MKKIIFILAILCCSTALWSQDIITMKNGEEIKAIVQEIGADYVKYKKFENKNGPTYTIQKSTVFMITYENGEKDIFDKSRTVTTSTQTITTHTTQPATTNSEQQVSLPPTQSNRKVKFGIEAGLAMANINSDIFKSSDLDNANVYPPRWGFTGGLLVDFRVAKMFSIQPELLVTMKGFRAEEYVTVSYTNGQYLEDVFMESNYNFTYLELPLNLIFNIPIQKDRLQVGAGAYLAYGIYGKCKSHLTYQGESLDEITPASLLEYKLFSGEQKLFKPFDWGVIFFVGYAFNDTFFLKAKYSLGIGDISAYDVGVKNTYWSLSFGAIF